MEALIVHLEGKVEGLLSRLEDMRDAMRSVSEAGMTTEL